VTISRFTTYISAAIFLAASLYLAPARAEGSTASARAQAMHTARSNAR